MRVLGLTAALAAVAVALAGPSASARPVPGPTVDVDPAARVSPDGHSLTVQVFASCPERAILVSAVVSASQAEASGEASFSLACIGSVRGFTVDVPAQAGTFDLGDARVHAVVTAKRGKVERAEDDKVVAVQPSVLVDLADTATLVAGSAAVNIDVSVACPVGAMPEQSYVNVSQGQTTIGRGTFLPVCDGARHTTSVRVDAAQGTYQAGDARALSFATVSYGGSTFSGVDDRPIRIAN